MKKNIHYLYLLLLLPVQALAQTLSLEQCYELARQHYPLLKQQELIRKSNAYSLDNIAKGAWPQVAIIGQASYQSDVTRIPLSLPGVPVLNKDQYRLYGELNQPITDLLTVKQQKELQAAQAEVQEQNLETELYKLRERVNQLFFGILLLEEQLKQNALLQKDIRNGIQKITAAVNNGTELPSNLDRLKVEELKAQQRDIELKNARKAYLEMLGLFTGNTLPENTVLSPPQVLLNSNPDIRRPELQYFASQGKIFDSQRQLINTRSLPKVFLFAQAGVGRPSPVNMLSNDFKTYYLGGLRLNWSLSSFYTSAKEKSLLDLGKKQVEVQKENFLFNTRFSLKQQEAEILKLQEMMNSDQEILRLRSSIKNTASAQLGNGVLTVSDYLREVNAEDQARQLALLHQLQLLLAQYNYKTIAGN